MVGSSKSSSHGSKRQKYSLTVSFSLAPLTQLIQIFVIKATKLGDTDYLLGNMIDKLVETNQNDANKLKDTWAIRVCQDYKDEYDDCVSIKARFHQYFVHGGNIDCTPWHTDYKNCVRYQESDGKDIEAGEAVIKSEEVRRRERMHDHYANNTWAKRKEPPADWAKPLPEAFAKRNENTYLEFKQAELDGKAAPMEDNYKSSCAIM